MQSRYPMADPILPVCCLALPSPPQAAARLLGCSAPTLVLEVALQQSSDSLLRKLDLWVTPWAQGGGGAELAVGWDIKGTQHTVHVMCQGGPLGQPLRFGRGTACTHRGDPRFFLWLPLSHLMPGLIPMTQALVSLCIAAGGAWDGLAAFFCMPPLRALRCAWRRWQGPWAALPLDLYELKVQVDKYL